MKPDKAPHGPYQYHALSLFGPWLHTGIPEGEPDKVAVQYLEAAVRTQKDGIEPPLTFDITMHYDTSSDKAVIAANVHHHDHWFWSVTLPSEDPDFVEGFLCQTIDTLAPMLPAPTYWGIHMRCGHWAARRSGDFLESDKVFPSLELLPIIKQGIKHLCNRARYKDGTWFDWDEEKRKEKESWQQFKREKQGIESLKSLFEGFNKMMNSGN